MALTWAERESVTNDFFQVDGGKAVDIYFNDSYALNYFLKQKKGIYERPEGGERFRVPLEYDEQVSGFYVKGDALDSDDRTSVNSAYFSSAHAYGNATIYRIDELKQGGKYGEVVLTTQRVAGAMKSLIKTLSGSFYDDTGAATGRLVGLRACCDGTNTSTKYGDIAQTELLASDGSYPWTGRRDTTGGNIKLSTLRTACTTAKVRDGKGGKPDIIFTTPTLFDVIADLLQVQQRFMEAKDVVDAGFRGIIFEGKRVIEDDYCPSGYFFAVNSMNYGFHIYKSGLFERTPWSVIPDSPQDKTMKILFDGQAVCSNRKAQIAYSGLS